MSYQLNSFSVNWGCTGPALHFDLSPCDVIRFCCGLCALWSLSNAGMESDAETTQQVSIAEQSEPVSVSTAGMLPNGDA